MPYQAKLSRTVAHLAKNLSGICMEPPLSESVGVTFGCQVRCMSSSMRTTGTVVSHGRSRKCLARMGPPEVVLRRGGCCTLVLHVERSSATKWSSQTGH